MTDVFVEIIDPGETIGVELVVGIPGPPGTGGGGGAVDSVNGETGVVVLDATDVGADPTGTAAALVDDLSGVTNAATARTNLGLGTAATQASSAFDTAGAAAAVAAAAVNDGDAAGGDLSGTYPNPSVVDDSHAHTTTTVSGLVAADVTDFDTQVRTSRLDQMAAPNADLSANSHKVTNVTDPGSAQDAATKAYVDANASAVPGVYGNGADGAVTLTQSSAAPAWAAKSGAGATTTFTLSRDLYATTIDLDDSAGNFLVKPNGFRLMASVSLTIDAGVTVHNDGNAASGSTAGGVTTATGTVAGNGTAGGAGNTAANGTAGTNTGNFSISSPIASSITGGKGGGTTAGTGNGVAGNRTSALTASAGSPNVITQALDMHAAGGVLTIFTGGAGGNGGDAAGGTAIGGGGGGGAGTLLIAAKLLTNNGTIRAKGGAGANGVVGSGTAAGGGGGGTGGGIVLVIGSGSTVGTTDVTGGAGGTGTGTGGTGATGPSGQVWTLTV